MICRRCGTVLPAGAHFCHSCAFTGAELHWAAAAAPIQPVRRGDSPLASPPRVVVLDRHPEVALPA